MQLVLNCNLITNIVHKVVYRMLLRSTKGLLVPVSIPSLVNTAVVRILHQE